MFFDLPILTTYLCIVHIFLCYMNHRFTYKNPCSNIHTDQTSRRSSYLSFRQVCLVSSLCFPFPFSMLFGDDGNFSMMEARGQSNSSSSSSLVYPFLCRTDTFLVNSDLPPASEIFSATAVDGGGVYTTGAAA